MSQSSSTAELFRHDLATGAVRREDDRRLLAVSDILIQGLHVAIIETLGEHAPDALYRTGFEWALQDMVVLHRRAADEFGGQADFWQMEPKFVLDAWWAALESAGWGAMAFEFGGLRTGLMLCELRQSVVAAVLPGVDQPICHLYAGLLAGALSFFLRSERHAVEIECRAMGADVCRFIVGPGAEIDSAESWRQQGTLAADIIRRLR